MCQLIGQNIINIKSTTSTNNYAISQVRDNETKEGTVFLAHEQTAGKGQMNNYWESETGKNLTFSIFINPNFLEIRQQYLISKVVCLGIENFLSTILENVKIKWPNDIYVKNKKICGMLIENSIMNGSILQSIIGIGLNVNQSDFISDAPNPTSLKIQTNKDFQLNQVLNELLNAIDFYYLKLRNGCDKELDDEFTQKLYQLNELNWYIDKHHSYQGKILGVNEIGQLRIQEINGEIHEYHFKEVSYLTEDPNK